MTQCDTEINYDLSVKKAWSYKTQDNAKQGGTIIKQQFKLPINQMSLDFEELYICEDRMPTGVYKQLNLSL